MKEFVAAAKHHITSVHEASINVMSSTSSQCWIQAFDFVVAAWCCRCVGDVLLHN